MLGLGWIQNIVTGEEIAGYGECEEKFIPGSTKGLIACTHTHTHTQNIHIR